MSLSRMKSWLLGYTIELCYNLDIIRLFIKAAEHSNQSLCFAFLNVFLYENLSYDFPFFFSVNPAKGLGLKMGLVAFFYYYYLFFLFFFHLGLSLWRWFPFAGMVLRAKVFDLLFSSSCIEKI